MVVQPALSRPEDTTYDFGGTFGDYLEAVSDGWLKLVPERNPALITNYATRGLCTGWDRVPSNYGEYRGKYLTGGVEVMRLTGDEELRRILAGFTAAMIAHQDENGYLGVWPKEDELTGASSLTNGPTWDAWSHYHLMLGLLLWHEETGDTAALEAVLKAADLLCDTFLGKPGSLHAIGSFWVNLAPLHVLSLLYNKTGTQRYLDLSRQIIEDEFTQSASGDYVNAALEGRDLYHTGWSGPRWEGLHAIIGIIETYRATGNEDYHKAFEHLWWSIARYDRHNTGAFSSFESAVGNPYDQRQIETCCVVAWTAMSVEMLRQTGNSIVADELELALLNAVYAYQLRHWHEENLRVCCTYNTPMDGRRYPKGGTWPGSPDFTCCSANAARGFGLVSSWALMEDESGLVLNWYGPSRMETVVGDVPVILTQETEYPRSGRISLDVSPARTASFDLRLRLPHWSRDTSMTVNGAPVSDLAPGTYIALSREWRPGDRIEIELDMSLHCWVGELQCEGKSSIYRGPVLLACRHDPEEDRPPPTLDPKTMAARLVDVDGEDPAMVAMACTDVEGEEALLRDFDSAGESGKHHVLSWLHVRDVAGTPFSKTNPLRSTRMSVP